MDAETKKLVDAYRWEGDVELERKRKVYLSFIVGQTQDDIRAQSMKLEENREMYEALSRIIRRREARKRISGEVSPALRARAFGGRHIGASWTRPLTSPPPRRTVAERYQRKSGTAR